MANNGGDVLARGARSARFPASGGNVSQEKSDAIWADEDEIAVQEETKKTKSKK